jgi:nucleoside-triphosphatase
MERLGVPALERALQSPRLAVIDEIGKMEIFSARFREVVSYAISSGNKILGTIMQESDPFADAVKSHPNVRLITVSRENRDDVLEELIRWTEPFRR